MHISPVTLNKIEISRNKVEVPEGASRLLQCSLQENIYLLHKEKTNFVIPGIERTRNDNPSKLKER